MDNSTGEDIVSRFNEAGSPIRIGTTGKPALYSFIQSGELAGNVILVSEDIVCLYGPFHEWYSNWIEISITEISNLPLLKKFKLA